MKFIPSRLLFFAYFFPLLSLPSSHLNEHLLKDMLKPIECTRKGIHTFFSYTYNHPAYKDFLSACFMHVLDLVEHAHSTCNEIEFLQQIFLVFTQKLQETHWVNPYALIYFLERVQTYLLDIYVSEKSVVHDFAQEHILQALKHDQILAYNDPETFVKKYIPSLVETIAEATTSSLTAKKSFVTFLEHAFLRIVFDHTEGYEIYECLKHLLTCTDHLYHLGLLLDEISYQRLIWILLNRFGYCIELHSEEIHDEEYEKIIEGLYAHPIQALQSPEIEELITPKQEWLSLKIRECKTKKRSRTFMNGILKNDINLIQAE